MKHRLLVLACLGLAHAACASAQLDVSLARAAFDTSRTNLRKQYEEETRAAREQYSRILAMAVKAATAQQDEVQLKALGVETERFGLTQLPPATPDPAVPDIVQRAGTTFGRKLSDARRNYAERKAKLIDVQRQRLDTIETHLTAANRAEEKAKIPEERKYLQAFAEDTWPDSVVQAGVPATVAPAAATNAP